MTLDPTVTEIIGTAATIAVSINIAFFKWLIDSFKHLRETVADIANLSRQQLDIHEAKDQTRHEENLYRFEKISVALARLGSANGTYESKEKELLS